LGSVLGLILGYLDGLTTPAVLHANVAVGTHMEPGLKTILEGHRGDMKVIAQALKAEVARFVFHGSSMTQYCNDLQREFSLDFTMFSIYIYRISG